MSDGQPDLLPLANALSGVDGYRSLGRALAKAGRILDLTIGLVFTAREGFPSLTPHDPETGFVDRLFAGLEWLCDRPTDLGGWQLDLTAPGPLSDLGRGLILTLGPAEGPETIGLSAREFLSVLLPDRFDCTDTLARQLIDWLNLSRLCLIPVGSDPLRGACLIAWPEGEQRPIGQRVELAHRLGDMLAPVLARLDRLTYLESLARETAAAGEIADILARPRLGLKKRLNLCLEVILSVLDSASGSIMLKKGSRLEVTAATNRKIIGLKQPIKADSISSRVARTGQALNLDLESDPSVSRHDGKYSSYAADQVLCAPIMAERKVVGVLNVTNRRDRRAFDRLEIDQVARFLMRVGSLLDRAALNESLKLERRRLAAANRELRQLEQMKRDLTNMVVHDLKGPLAEIVANLHMVQADELSEFGVELVDSALIGTDDMSRMIANLLDISRMEDGRLRLSPRAVDIASVFEKSIERLKSIIALKEIKPTNLAPADLPAVRADEGLTERIIQNLLTNAVDHTPEGTALEFTARPERDRMVISLRDHGQGVPESHREAIFQMFTQAPDRDKPRTSTGLGLTFCRMAVEAHGGRIWVEEADGGGADFKFTLPLLGEAS